MSKVPTTMPRRRLEKPCCAQSSSLENIPAPCHKRKPQKANGAREVTQLSELIGGSDQPARPALNAGATRRGAQASGQRNYTKSEPIER